MSYFYYFELLAIILLFLTAFYEFHYIYSFNNDFLPKNGVIRNVDLIDKSVKIILKEKFGELIVFMYPISFILVGLLILFIFSMNNIKNEFYLYNFIIISIIVISLHVIIPYYFSYLKFAEESLKKEFNLIDWLEIRMHSIERELTSTKEYVFDLNMLIVIDNNVFHKNNYDKYLEAVNVLKEKMCLTYNNITYEEYIRIIPFLTGFNFFVKENHDLKELIISEDKYEINNIDFGLKQMYFSFFNKNNLHTTFLSRYVEIIMFFMIINILLILSNQL